MSESCTQCRNILGRLVKRHAPDDCPLISSSYCGLCASYGHSPSTCADAVTQAYREPQFVEQLVPAGFLEEYGIRSQTPLPGAVKRMEVAQATQRLMEVPETDEALRAALTAAGVKPMICQEKGKKENKEITENKKRLQKVADKMGRKLVFLPVLK